MELNEVTKRLPKHLLQFVVDQPYSEYTPIDHAVWRYVMRRNCNHLRKIAHESYLHGLQVTGVEIDRIPTMYGMNRILKEIGWAAVAVDGFIPPGAFMEFTQYNVLVIAADIRTIEHIEYTPAPDIIHESAGHAPILAVPEFADYLRAIGEAGAKAFSSRKDVELYEAIRHLSIIKEDPSTNAEEVTIAERNIEIIQQNMGEPSELALIRNLHWWTVEYGLIGTIDNFKLYGAGLLSSIGEAISCLSKEVKKIPYSLEAMNYNYDITKPQPQLFVTPDFSHLMTVLEEFKQRMAWTQGGLDGVRKAIDSQQTSTLTLDSGLQVTGTFSEVIEMNGEPVLIRTDGPTAFSFGNKQLTGYGKGDLSDRIVAVLGHLNNTTVPMEGLQDADLADRGILMGTPAYLPFKSGVVVQGTVRDIHRGPNGQLLFINFSDVYVAYQGNVLWKATSGTIPFGSHVASAFSGAADIDAFEPAAAVPREKMHKIHHDESGLRLQGLYGDVRNMRENVVNCARLEAIFNTLKTDFDRDWLLPLEILELLEIHCVNSTLRQDVRTYLEQKTATDPALSQLIHNGLDLLAAPETQSLS